MRGRRIEMQIAAVVNIVDSERERITTHPTRKVDLGAGWLLYTQAQATYFLHGQRHAAVS